jgi:hypothetical protein
MATTRALTGGTLDVNPQWWTLGKIRQTGPNTVITEAILVPVNRYPQGKSGRVNVIEVLKVMWETFVYPLWPDNGGVNLGGMTATLSTRNPGGNYPVLEDPSVIDIVVKDWYTSGSTGPETRTAATTWVDEEPIIHDLTDGAGHGILIASDQIYVTLATNTMSNNAEHLAEVKVKILYRYKQVSLTEYIGIVQSQQ